MAFITLLLTSLVFLTQVNLAEVVTNSSRVKAEQNALIGLRIALGELQRHTGPDQRTTALAELRGYKNDGVRRWTGAWGNLNAPQSIYDLPPQPVQLSWLVSRNENASTYDVGTSGEITNFVESFHATPSMTVNGLTANTPPGRANIYLGNDLPATVLMGSGSTGSVADYVIAPLVEIQDSQGQSSGNYAWAVIDEGVKAKYNLLDGHRTRTADDPLRTLISQRYAIETLPEHASYPVDQPNIASLWHMSSMHDLMLVDPNLTKAQQLSSEPDLTVYSQGLLADSLHGGLRQDLSYLLDDSGAVGTAAELTGNILPQDDNLFTGASQLQGPYWEALSSAYNLPSGTMTIAPASDTQTGITPTIAQLRFFVSMEVDSNQRWWIQFRPIFVLGNLYSRSMTGPIKISIRTGHIYTWLDTDGSPVEYDLYGMLKDITFEISDVSLEPGQIKAFSLQSTQEYSSSGITLELEAPIGTPAVLNVLHSIRFDTNHTVPATSFSLPGNPIPAQPWTVEYQVQGSMDITLKASGNKVLQRVSNVSLGATTKHTKSIPAALTAELPFVEDLEGHIYTLRPWLKNVSNVRPFADYNLRGQELYRPSVHSSGKGLYNNPLYASGVYSLLSPDPFSEFTQDLNPPFWGNSFGANGQSRVVLYDLPSATAGAPIPFLSLAQLRHIDLSADSLYLSTGMQPGYTFGNSRASPYVSTTKASELRDGEHYYDISYLLNSALWDRYFLSTIPQQHDLTVADFPLANGKLQLMSLDASPLNDLQDTIAPAERMLLNGAFNINSTSVKAWATLFASLKGTEINGEADLSAPMPRSINQTGGSVNAGNGKSQDAFDGFRNLTSNEIYDPITETGLAYEIVKEVETRGPFISLAQFVNRTLADTSTTSNTELALKGPLQTAIDRAGLNSEFPISDYKDASQLENNESTAYAAPLAAEGQRYTGIPGWLDQGDILQVIGSSISARSDTFIIRAYGDSINPLTNQVEGSAWCEAVVQRLPEYVEPDVDSPEIATAALQSNINRKLGRGYHIVKFRWLTKDEV